MRKHLFVPILSLAVALCLCSLATGAEPKFDISVSDKTLTGQKLPAGDYRIVVSTTMADKLWRPFFTAFIRSTCGAIQRHDKKRDQFARPQGGVTTIDDFIVTQKPPFTAVRLMPKSIGKKMIFEVDGAVPAKKLNVLAFGNTLKSEKKKDAGKTRVIIFEAK